MVNKLNSSFLSKMKVPRSISSKVLSTGIGYKILVSGICLGLALSAPKKAEAFSFSDYNPFAKDKVENDILKGYSNSDKKNYWNKFDLPGEYRGTPEQDTVLGKEIITYNEKLDAEITVSLNSNYEYEDYSELGAYANKDKIKNNIKGKNKVAIKNPEKRPEKEKGKKNITKVITPVEKPIFYKKIVKKPITEDEILPKQDVKKKNIAVRKESNKLTLRKSKGSINIIPSKNGVNAGYKFEDENYRCNISAGGDIVNADIELGGECATLIGEETGIIGTTKVSQNLKKMTASFNHKDFVFTTGFLQKNVETSFNGIKFDSDINQLSIGGDYDYLLGDEYKLSRFVHSVKGKAYYITSGGDDKGIVGDSYVGINKVKTLGGGGDMRIKLSEKIALDFGLALEKFDATNSYNSGENGFTLTNNTLLTYQPTNNQRFSIGTLNNENYNITSLSIEHNFRNGYIASLTGENIRYADKYLKNENVLFLRLKKIMNFSSGFRDLFSKKKKKYSVDRVRHSDGANKDYIVNISSYSAKISNSTNTTLTVGDITGLGLLAASDTGTVGDNHTSETSPTIVFDTSDHDSYKYSINGSTPVTITPTLNGSKYEYVIPTVLDNNEHTVEITGVTGGVEGNSTSLTFTVNNLTPTSVGSQIDPLDVQPSVQGANYPDVTIILDNKLDTGASISVTSRNGGSIGGYTVDSDGNIQITNYTAPNTTIDYIDIVGTTKAGVMINISIRITGLS